MKINGPIFIGGVSYSGKTQLRFLLSNHPNIVITRRTYLWRKYNHAFGNLEDEHNFEKCLAAVMDLKAIQNLNPDPARIRKEFWQGEHSYGHLFSIIHRQYAEQLGKERWGIQIGMVEREVNILIQDDPNTKIVQLIRNPFERVAESISKSSRRKLALGRETNLWRASARLAQENLEKYPHNYMVVRWEDLKRDLDQTLNRICNFIGEVYQPEIITNEKLAELGLSIDKESIMGSRRLLEKNLSPDQKLVKNEIKYISDTAGKEMSWYGYKSPKNNQANIDKLKYLMIDYPIYYLGDLIKQPLQLLREGKKNNLLKGFIWEKIT